MMRLEDEIKREIDTSSDIHGIKAQLVKRGYDREDIDRAFKNVVHADGVKKDTNNARFSAKELLDRIGYGFSSLQFINILFLLSGASFFLIGFFNGLKAALSYFLSGFLSEYVKFKNINKTAIGLSGVVFGLSFFCMAIAAVIHSPILFAGAFIVGTIGVLAHGDSYLDFYNKTSKGEKRNFFLKFISYFGILITAVSLLVAGFLMQSIPINGYLLTIDFSAIGFSTLAFNVYGYLLAFVITAVLFVVSGIILYRIEEHLSPIQNDGAWYTFISGYIKRANADTKIFTKNKKVFFLMLATVVTTVVQILANAYYGIYIYQNYQTVFWHGFLNVAIIFVIALIASITGSMLTKSFAKTLGEAPMLVFGTLLIALLPLTLYYNHSLYAIGLATALSVVGGAIVGVAQGLMAERLLDENEVKQYFSSLGFVSIIPILLIVTIGSVAAQLFYIETLFLILGLILAGIVMPLYFVIVLIVNKEYNEKLKARTGK